MRSRPIGVLLTPAGEGRKAAGTDGVAVAVGGGGRGMGTPAAAAPLAPQRPTLAVDGTLRQLARAELLPLLGRLRLERRAEGVALVEAPEFVRRDAVEG